MKDIFASESSEKNKIEKGIMQRGIDQRKGQNVPQV